MRALRSRTDGGVGGSGDAGGGLTGKRGSARASPWMDDTERTRRCEWREVRFDSTPLAAAEVAPSPMTD